MSADQHRPVRPSTRDPSAREVVERFGEVLDTLPDAVVFCDGQGCIVLANSQSEVMFGCPREDMLGQQIEMLMPERFRGQHGRHRQRFLSDPRVRPMGAGLALFGLRRDGSEFPVEVSLSPLDTPAGRLVSCAIRDTTERARYEHALEEKNVALLKADKAKDNFLATMSHELRTPLNAIIGFTGTLLMKLPGPLNAAQEKQLRTVQEGARHLLALINDLLDLTKIEAGKVELDIEPTHWDGIVDEVVDTLRPQAEAKGLYLRVEGADRTLIARTDRRALLQIVLNLTSNAIKFTGSGGVTVRLSEGGDAGGARRVEIAVVDTGPGIGVEDQARLFGAFVQLNTGGGRRKEGAGLGLHLSQRLAGLIGGRITLDSAPGRGSTFVLTVVDDQPSCRPAS